MAKKKSDGFKFGPVSGRPYNNASTPALKWTVSWPGTGGRRKRRRFETKKAATDFARLKETEIHNAGVKGAGLRDSAVREAVEAAEILEPFGVSILDAAKFYAETMAARERSVDVATAALDYYADKEKDGLSNLHLKGIRQKLQRFSESFGKRIVSDIRTREVSDWLRSLKVSPKTRTNYRTYLSGFFSWAVECELCDSSPVANSAKVKVPKPDVVVYTPGEMRIILDAAATAELRLERDDGTPYRCTFEARELLPWLAIGAFAGLRASEIDGLTDKDRSPLDWRNVDFLDGKVTVDASKTETGAHRHVPMTDALKAWLHPLAQAAGPVIRSNFSRKLKAFKAHLRTLGVKWKRNALRRSFGSYMLAHTQDAPKVAAWLGHESTSMLFKNYRTRVTSKEAEEYLAILPSDADGKVTPIESVRRRPAQRSHTGV